MALYERLRTVNPAPFAALAQFQDWRLLSSSPERLVRVVAGASRRGHRRHAAAQRCMRRDQGEIAALIAHRRSAPEHVMLIDLERNDLGRICRSGSVHVDEFMRIESYPHVHHIVSNVAGVAAAPVADRCACGRCFPGHHYWMSEIRCMQIIAELEAKRARPTPVALASSTSTVRWTSISCPQHDTA